MSTQTFLAIGATGKTGQHTVQHLLDRGHAVRAMVHKEDERSEALELSLNLGDGRGQAAAA
jgi:NAD(P)H dehydrogenase (quinone)